MFDLSDLMNIYPIRTDTKEELMHELVGLERKGLLQLLPGDMRSSILYRFTFRFMREVAYQRMLFAHRKKLHRAAAEHFQTLASELPMDQTDDKLFMNLVWQYNMAGAKDKVAEFHAKARKANSFKKVVNGELS